MNKNWFEGLNKKTIARSFLINNGASPHNVAIVQYSWRQMDYFDIT